MPVGGDNCREAAFCAGDTLPKMSQVKRPQLQACAYSLLGDMSREGESRAPFTTIPSSSSRSSATATARMENAEQDGGWSRGTWGEG